MKIVVCGLMTNYGKMVILKEKLKKLKHTVILPNPACLRSSQQINKGKYEDTFRLKKRYDFILKHYKNICKSDCILVVNYDKNGVENYIGGNSFLEMGFAHILNKPIFLLNSIPEISYYYHEMKAVNPIVIKGNLKKIKS